MNLLGVTNLLRFYLTMIRRNNKWEKLWRWFTASPGGHEPDYTFIILLFVVLILGLAFLSSASSVISYDKFGDAYLYFKQQLVKGIFLGLIGFIIISRIKYENLKKIALPFLTISLVLIVLVLIPGIGVEQLGGRRWLPLPGWDTLFQPSEFLKLSLIIYLAAWFDARQKQIKDFKQLFIPLVLLLVLVAGLILLQPDMGTTILVLAICVSIYFFAGGSISWIIGLGGVGFLIFWFLIKQAPYRADRLTIFLHPELDQQGIGYHINQAFLAIGSGGIFGRGFGHSRQKYNYLPEVISDSIFAIIAEELGFIFTVLFLSLFFYFFYRGLRIARLAPDMFSRLLAVGIMSWIIWQFALNIMAMVGLIPLTGAPLPFISHGSSSLVILLVAMGIVVNISRYTKSR